MKIYHNKTGIDTYIGVSFSDIELNHQHTNVMLNRFYISILNKLACMIAAYWFKQNKTFVDEFIKSDELKEVIANKLVEKIRMEVD